MNSNYSFNKDDLKQQKSEEMPLNFTGTLQNTICPSKQ